MKLRGYLFATTVFAFMPALAMAQAQTTANSATPAAAGAAAAAEPSTSGQVTLGEVVVTAQRRSESSQRAAVPLNVVAGAALLASGVTQADRLNSLAPALSIQPTSNGNLMFVRGVGNFTLTPDSDPAIAFNYDGVYIGRPTSTTGIFYDLNRVEILKGPQGILYGRNATGGAINVLPAQPLLGDPAPSGYVSATYGDYDTLNAEGAVNLPVGDNAAIRLSGARSGHSGYLSDGASDEDTWAGRAQFKAKVTSDLTVRVGADFAHNGGKGSGIDYLGVYTGGGANFTPAGIPLGTGILAPQSQAYRAGVVFAPLGNHLPPLTAPFQDNKFYGVNAEINYKTNAGTLTIIPAWREADLDYLANGGAAPYLDRERDSQYSFEARFAGERIGPLDYQFGGYFFGESIHATTLLTAGSLGNFETPTYQSKSYAGFGQATFHVTHRLRLVGGLRFTRDDKTFSTDQISAILVCTVFTAQRCATAPTVPLFNGSFQLGYPFPSKSGGVLPVIPTGALSIRSDAIYNNVSQQTDKPTYRAGVEYDVLPQSIAYATIETGYRSGGFSAAAGYDTYLPETITAYTLGMKNRLFNNRLQVNLEGFIWDYKNQQVTHIGLDTNNQVAYFTQNAGSSTIKGIEVDGKLVVTPTTLVSADIQYLDAVQQKFTYLQGASSPAITGCAVSTVSGGTEYLINCSGKPSYNSPKWTLNFTGQQKLITFESSELVLDVDTQYRSSRYIGFAYLPQQLIGPTWTTNAQLQYGPAGQRWSVAVFVRNLEDDRIPIYSNTHPTANFLTAGTTAPRTFGVRVTAKY